MIDPVSGSFGSNQQYPEPTDLRSKETGSYPNDSQDLYNKVLEDLYNSRISIRNNPNFQGLSSEEISQKLSDMLDLCDKEGSQVKSFDFYFSSNENKAKIMDSLGDGTSQPDALTMIDKLHGLLNPSAPN